MDNLLKEAIADAKAVRETAFANAKLALEEAFTPKLQSMLSAKLQNEMEGEPDETNVGFADTNQDEVDPTLEAVDVTADAGNDPEKEKAGAVGTDADGWKSGSDDTETAQQTLTEEDDLPMDDEEVPVEEPVLDPAISGEEDEEIPVDDDSITSEAEGVPFDGEDEMSPEGEYGDDVELEAIIKELEAEEEPPVEEPVFDEEPSEEVPVEEPVLEPELEEEAVDVTADAGNDPEKGKGSAVGPESGSEDAEKAQQKLTEEEEEDGDSEEKELDLEQLVKEINEELDDEEEDKEKEMAFEGLKKEVSKLSKSLREHRGVVKFLKDKLVEVNLLNAKLLYSNKIFRSFALNENQKKRVIEAIDRANSAREVKLVYTALHESLRIKKSALSESAKPTKKVMGSASRATASTKPKEKINESNDLKERFRKLSGASKGISRFV